MTKLLQCSVYAWLLVICVRKIKITKMLQYQADCNNNHAYVCKAFFHRGHKFNKYILYIRLLHREMICLPGGVMNQKGR